MSAPASYLLLGITLAIAMLAARGLIWIIEGPRAHREALRAERARRQAEIRGRIYDATRSDDPLVRLELHEAISEHRAAS